MIQLFDSLDYFKKCKYKKKTINCFETLKLSHKPKNK